jgi:hypothetical protein
MSNIRTRMAICLLTIDFISSMKALLSGRSAEDPEQNSESNWMWVFGRETFSDDISKTMSRDCVQPTSETSFNRTRWI